MNVRHLATKSFSGGVRQTKQMLYENSPMSVRLSGSSKREETVAISKPIPSKISMSHEINTGKDKLIDSPISCVVFDKNNDMLPLSQIYGYSVANGDSFSEFLPIGVPFSSILEDSETESFMREVAQEMFPLINPNTDLWDIDPHAFYAPYVPLAILSGTITPQVDDDKAYFNPEGTVSVAEFLDSLNAIKFGCNSNASRRKTMDNISDEKDYFNEGYNSCLRGISSPFFNLYTREELTKPITRLELAYITVICWDEFLDKFNAVHCGTYYLGINADWEHPAEYLSEFEDGYGYKVSKVSYDNDLEVVSLNIHDYKADMSMTEYKKSLQYGLSAIPLPMYMSMVELDRLHAFWFNNRLDPMKEVSRAELCYFITMIAKTFTMTYIR